MKLNGKAKELFEEWFNHGLEDWGDGYGHYLIEKFYKEHPSLQWGVLQDWADSLGIECVVEYWDESSFAYWVHAQGGKIRLNSADGFEPSRQEARNAAIKKLNELVNEQ